MGAALLKKTHWEPNVFFLLLIFLAHSINYNLRNYSEILRLFSINIVQQVSGVVKVIFDISS